MTTGGGQQRPPPDEGPEDESSNSTTTCEIGKALWRRIWALLGCGDEDSSGSSKLWLAKEVVGGSGSGSGSGRSRSGSTNLRFLIHPDNWWYVAWTYFILVWAVYSSFFTPLEFGFFRGLPERLFLLDIAGQIAFLADIALQFNLAYRNAHTYRIVYSRNQIALRYLKSRFGVDLLGCLPWDAIYKACGRKEAVRYMLWIRLSRALRVTEFFEKLEKEIRINYLFTRIVKLLVVEYYCTHTAACIFYYLATTVPPSHEGYTWMGSLQMGDFHYSNFRDIDLWKRYVTSLYFAVVTMATVGYGEIHAVNVREMIFVMIYVSFDMILGAYLLGNMTALIVKGSKTERFRDKMSEVLKYVNRNNLGKQICNEVKGHLRLQYERSCNEAAVLQDIPASIRTKISQKLYEPFIKEASLFKGCSSGFIKQIAVRVHEEFFLPGEVIIEQGKIADQLYIVCHGELEEVARGKDDESEDIVVNLQMYSIFGELSFLCNIPQPYAVRVRELSQVLRLDKQSWTEILEVYFFDGTIILDNLLEGKDPELQNMILASDVTLYIGKHESELALKLNAATYDGNLHQVKRLIGAGADPKKTDYDGRSPLHIAACKGYEEVTAFLIEQGLDTNAVDKFGNTPLLEAVKNRRDQVALLLVNAGASLLIDNEGVFLCTTVARKEVGLLRRLLDAGANPNAKDYDFRTPLHVAASEGANVAVRLLLDAGGSIFSKDRWGHTPLDEARIGGNKDLIKLLEAARSSQISKFSCSSQQTGDGAHRKKCTVFPFHPWTEEKRRLGVVEWVPEAMDELIKTAVERLKCPNGEYSILSEDGAKIMDVDMIDSGQKLFLVVET